MKKKVKKIIFNILLVYFCLAAALYLIQRSFIYFPSKRALDHTQFDTVEVVTVTTSDGLDLNGWYIAPDGDKEIIVFFHGNASNHLGSLYTLQHYIQQGYGILSVGYRGYSGNPAKPSEKGFYKDARAFLDYLTSQNIPNNQIILYGQSIGSGVAVQMATEFKNIRAMILESPFTKLPDIAKEQFFFLPVNLMMKDKFDNIGKISNVEAPLIIVQGMNDQMIKPQLGQRVFEKANSPKEIIQLEGFGHNDLPVKEMTDRVIKALQKL
jgi:hypothetical protein